MEICGHYTVQSRAPWFESQVRVKREAEGLQFQPGERIPPPIPRILSSPKMVLCRRTVGNKEITWKSTVCVEFRRRRDGRF